MESRALLRTYIGTEEMADFQGLRASCYGRHLLKPTVSVGALFRIQLNCTHDNQGAIELQAEASPLSKPSEKIGSETSMST